MGEESQFSLADSSVQRTEQVEALGSATSAPKGTAGEFSIGQTTAPTGTTGTTSIFDPVASGYSANATLESVQSQMAIARSQMQQASAQLAALSPEQQAQVEQSSYTQLAYNHLQQVNDGINALAKRFQIPLADSIIPSQLTPGEKKAAYFLNFLTGSEARMNQLSGSLSSMNQSDVKIPTLLSAQVKINQINMQLSMFTTLLGSAMGSLKTLMSVQV